MLKNKISTSNQKNLFTKLEKGFWNLDNPIVKVTPPNTHIPFAPVLEDAFIPSVEKVVKAVKELQ